MNTCTAYETQLAELFEGYSTGMYLDGEVISICMDILAEQEEKLVIWSSLPEWVAKEIVFRLRNFSLDDEFVTFGRGDSAEVKAKMLNLKAWLRFSELITG